MTPLADRCAFAIPAIAGQVLEVENPRAGSVVRDSWSVIREEGKERSREEGEV